MISRLLYGITVAYGGLLTLAAGGLAFANIVGLIGFIGPLLVGKKPVPETMLLWVHGGWVLGVVVAIVGIAFKVRRRRQREPVDKAPRKKTTSNWRQKSQSGKRLGVIPSFLLGGVGGGFLGGMLGGTFVMIWFSLTYSPFAPKGWASTVEVEQRYFPEHEPVLTTNHPLPKYAFGIPCGLGVVSGAVLGGVFGVYVEK